MVSEVKYKIYCDGMVLIKKPHLRLLEFGRQLWTGRVAVTSAYSMVSERM